MPPRQTVQVTHHLADGEMLDDTTMLTEALVVWDESEDRGMDDERFMLAYVSANEAPDDPAERGLALSALGPLMPVVQESPAAFLREIARASRDELRAMFSRTEEKGRKVAGLACFVHVWALTGQAMDDFQASGSTGNPIDHPDRVRLRMMAAHYRDTTLTLGRAADSDLVLPVPEEQFGPLLPALVAASKALAASREEEPA